MEKDLLSLRKEINEIDDNLKALYLKRMEIVKAIGKIKKENNIPVFDNKREQEQKQVLKNSSNLLINYYYYQVFETILKTSKEYQNTLIDIIDQ